MGPDISKLIEVLTVKINTWIISAVKMLPNLVLAVTVFVLFFYVAKLTKKGLERFFHRVSNHATLTRLGTGVVFTIMVTIGLFISLGILNLDKTVTSLLAGAGVLGLALGFAFQEIASNFLAGIFLAVEKPIREGDIVTIGEYTGVVSVINLRTTRIKDFNGLEIQVPNKNMFTEILTNYTSTPDRRVQINVGVSYGEDLRRVTEITREALQDVTHRLPGKDVDVFFTGFGESSIDFQARFWINYTQNRTYFEATHDAILRIKEAFDKNDIAIPFPIRTLDFGAKGGVSLREEVSHFVPKLQPSGSARDRET